MNVPIWAKAYLLAIVTLLVAADAMRFSSGATSLAFLIPWLWIAYSFLLTWWLLWIAWILFVQKELSVRHRVLVPILLAAGGVAIVMASGPIRETSIARLGQRVTQFVSDPSNRDVLASDTDRQLLAELTRAPYSLHFEGFIPTEQRIDYRLDTASGKQYLIILTRAKNFQLTANIYPQGG